MSRNVKIRAMSRKNGINCDASWLRILCCSGGGDDGDGSENVDDGDGDDHDDGGDDDDDSEQEITLCRVVTLNW